MRDGFKEASESRQCPRDDVAETRPRRDIRYFLSGGSFDLVEACGIEPVQ
jgi:hypothetical protein